MRYIILAKNTNDQDGIFTEQVPFPDSIYDAESALDAVHQSLNDPAIDVDVEGTADRLKQEGKDRIISAVVNLEEDTVTLVSLVPHVPEVGAPHFDVGEIPYSSLARAGSALPL